MTREEIIWIIWFMIFVFMILVLCLVSARLGYLKGWDEGFDRGFFNGADCAEERISEHNLRSKIIVNGNCMICGKPLTGNNLFICEECQKIESEKT